VSFITNGEKAAVIKSLQGKADAAFPNHAV
jgi:hypothetical protein